MTRRWRDLPGDPGLVPTTLASERGPYVGRAARRVRRFARDPELDALLVELARGFGPQRWWPAATPFEVIVGAILTQNTTWTNVERALARLRRARALTPASLLRLDVQRVAELVRPSGYFNVKARKLQAIARFYLEGGGLEAFVRRPLDDVRAALLDVWGVGPETADSILCYAAGRRTAVVDAYARRVLERHGLVAAGLSYADARGWLMERLLPSQAVYEESHALFVRAGYDNCKPRAACESCPATTPSRLA